MFCRAKDENALELDFGAIDFTTPRLNLSSSIGNGADYISKFISSKLGGNTDKLEPLLNYLLRLNHHGEVLTLSYSCFYFDLLSSQVNSFMVIYVFRIS